MQSNMLPLGFGLALAQNEAAMRQFEALTEAEKAALVRRAGKVRSKSEMRQLVSELID